MKWLANIGGKRWLHAAFTGTGPAERLAELAAAFALLTRLPIAWATRNATAETFTRSIWAYPLVGTVVGALAAAPYALGIRAGLAPAVCAVCAVAAAVLVTGGLHEDGLADMADGFGGGRSRDRKLEIMRDSRVGSYGVLVLVLSLLARVAALTAIAASGKVALVLISAGSLSRGAILLPLLFLSPARRDGLGATLQDSQSCPALLGLAFSVAIAFLLLPPGAAAVALVTAMLTAAAIGLLSWRQIGGYTGDTLGAVAGVAECAVLGLLTARAINT